MLCMRLVGMVGKCTNTVQNLLKSLIQITATIKWPIWIMCIDCSGIMYWRRRSLVGLHQDYDLASHATYVVCINFIHKWRDLIFKVDSEHDRYLRRFPWQFYLFLESFLLRVSRRRNIFLFLFIFRFIADVWPGIWTVASCLICQHTTY